MKNGDAAGVCLRRFLGTWDQQWTLTAFSPPQDEVTRPTATTDQRAARAVGVAGLWLFVRRQQSSAHPMIDVTLFRNPAFSGAVGAALGIAVLGTVLSAWAAISTFTEAMQGTALVAAALLAVAAFVAYRLIPSGTPRPAVRATVP